MPLLRRKYHQISTIAYLCLTTKNSFTHLAHNHRQQLWDNCRYVRGVSNGVNRFVGFQLFYCQIFFFIVRKKLIWKLKKKRKRYFLSYVICLVPGLYNCKKENAVLCSSKACLWSISCLHVICCIFQGMGSDHNSPRLFYQPKYIVSL